MKTATTTMMHIVGAHGFFEFQQVDDVDPRRSADFRKSIAVGTIPAGTVPAAVPEGAVPADEATTQRTTISNVVSQTAILNDAANAGWNCQHWVADALGRMQSAGWITRAQVSEACQAWNFQQSLPTTIPSLAPRQTWNFQQSVSIVAARQTSPHGI